MSWGCPFCCTRQTQDKATATCPLAHLGGWMRLLTFPAPEQFGRLFLLTQQGKPRLPLLLRLLSWALFCLSPSWRGGGGWGRRVGFVPRVVVGGGAVSSLRNPQASLLEQHCPRLGARGLGTHPAEVDKSGSPCPEP